MHTASTLTARALACVVAFAIMTIGAAGIAAAQQAVEVGAQPAIALMPALTYHRDAGPSLSVQAAPDQDGIINRIEVRSSADNPSGNWATIALANPSDEQVDRLLVAPRYRLAGSGVLRPDLGRPRIAAITPSAGFALDRQADDQADIFRITLDPRSVVTLVIELESARLADLSLWEPDAYKDAVNSLTLYEGIVLGIAGLLAVFLTILFVVKGSAMFPATAALAWAVLAYVCVDFGFVGRIVDATARDVAIWRATAEVFLAFTLVIFLYAYLHLNRFGTRYTYLMGLWLLGLLAVMGAALFAPERAAGIARISLAAIGLAGLTVILGLALRGFDRAVLVTPAWLLLLCWVGAGFAIVSGRLDNDIVQAALSGGLVLIVLLLAFTVMQHAFAGTGAVQSLVSDAEQQALALTGAGDAVFDWDVDRDQIKVGREITGHLGLPPDALDGRPNDWNTVLHTQDWDRFSTMLDLMLEHRRGRIDEDLRLRAHNGQYHWVRLRARPVIGSDGEVMRCVGTLADITDQRMARERLLRDAVRDNLTGLPNVELLTDRLDAALTMARAESGPKPTLMIIDIDGFGSINDSVGMGAGDALLMAIGKRIGRLVKPVDTVARLDGDRFAILLLSERRPERFAVIADALRRAIALPVRFGGDALHCTASIGLVGYSADSDAETMMRDGEIAVMRAKRDGGDRIEPFRPAYRSQPLPMVDLETELPGAVDRGEMSLVYQPIIGLKDRSVAGFEALLRWDHPRRGRIAPDEFVPIAERTGLIADLGVFALRTALRQVVRWRDLLGTEAFVSVNLSSRQLLRQDLVDDVRQALAEFDLEGDALCLELTESQVMDNPENAEQLLRRLREVGIRLALDDFGTGYSSLSHLMRYPFDTIKIDRSFVTGEEAGRAIVLRSIVKMVHELKMSVVAEGAEDEDDARELEVLGCEFAQGFHFARPMDAREAIGWLRKARAA